MKRIKGLPLTLAGRAYEVTHESVPTEEVRLNPDNPRIRFQIASKHGSKKLSEADLIKLVRDQAGYDALQKSIRKGGGISDAIIVRHDGLVVEGNSRATAYKTLREGNRADPRWKRMPVIRLPKGVPDDVLARLMASYHIAGKTVWRPYAQADQIFHMRNTHKLSLEQIADETRMSSREVQQYLDAYAYLVHEVLPHVQHGSANGLLESKFSHALEFVTRKNLAVLRENPEVRKHVAKLLVEDKIKGIEVRDLDKVLRNRRASTALRRDGFKAAKEVLSATDPLAASKILREMKALAKALAKMGQADIALLKSSPKAREIFVDLSDAIQNVASIASVDLESRNAA